MEMMAIEVEHRAMEITGGTQNTMKVTMRGMDTLSKRPPGSWVRDLRVRDLRVRDLRVRD